MLNNGLRILLIDADPDASNLLNRMLKKSGESGFILEWVDRLSKALNRLYLDRYDIILMNLSLPETKGLNSLKKMQIRAPDVPIIILSDNNDHELAVKAVQTGAQDFVPKNKLNSVMIQRVIRYAIERKQTEKELITHYRELQEMKMKYQAVLRSTPNGLCMLSSNWLIMWANQAMKNILDPTGTQSSVKKDLTPFSVLFPDKDSFVHYKKSVRESFRNRISGIDFRELEILKGDGTPLQVEISIVRMDPSETGGGYVATISDISERKRAEHAIRDTKRKLEEQRVLSVRSDRLRSIGEMATGMAHELNQPLMGVRGLTEHILISMERGWKLPEDKIKEKLRLIIDQADRMSSTIEHMRTYAREAGKNEIQPVKINDVIRTCLDMMLVQFRNHGLKVDCELEEGLPVISANPYSVEEAILNLMLNARDAVEDRQTAGAPSTSPKILVKTRKNGKSIKIIIRDWGDGIPEEMIETVFDPFFTTKGPLKGSGLGLPISKSIIEEFGGKLNLQSEKGAGTTVTITMPISQVQERHVG